MVSGGQHHRRPDCPVGQGYLGGSTSAEGCRDARNHFEGNAGLSQSFCLFAPATEDVGITSFEPAH